MTNPVVSIVIRTLNEADKLSELLSVLKTQQGIDLADVELIVVDNESTDQTQEVAKAFRAKVLTIPKNSFTYPKSMNMGLAAARAPIVILTVGHAVPVSDSWIKAALYYFDDPKIAGVYGAVLPNKNAGFVERLMYNRDYQKALRNNPLRLNKKVDTGVFGATNLAIRKSLWDKHNFEEKYELGGEDTQWAEWAFSQGYTIVRDTAFSVRHSHGLSAFGYLKQIKYWKALSKPTKFSKKALNFRKDIKWQD